MKRTFYAILLKGLFLSLLFPFTASATVTITAVNGASRVEGIGVANTAIEILAGAYNSSTSKCSSVGSTSTCNTCDATTTACNSQAVHRNLTLNITFSSDALTTGNWYPVVYLKQQANNINLTLENGAGSSLASNNTPVTVSVTWLEICSKWNDGTTTANDDCLFNAEALIGVGFSNTIGVVSGITEFLETSRVLVQGDSTGGGAQNYCTNSSDISGKSGVCNFTAFPGDTKFFIEDVKVESGFPSQGTSVNFEAIRVYYSDVGFSSITPQSPFADLEVGTTSSNNTANMEENTVENLENGTKYYFRVATVDRARNVNFFTGFNNDDANCFTGAEVNPCHEGTPEAVIGLLEDEFDCFIATASFGSPFEKHVRDLRKFRSRYLRHSYLGRKFIQFYYRNSPPIAHWIKTHPSVKPLVRLLLWPVWFFAKLCLQYGHLAGLGLMGLLMIFFFFRLSGAGVRKA